MAYHFKNLVFEGGGVKGIAYLGALEVLEEKGIMQNIKRVGGTSVGAINAVLIALKYTRDEQKKILWNLDFKDFQDSTWGIFRNLYRVMNRYGWNKGDFAKKWIGNLVADKLGNPEATFKDLKAKGYPDLYVYGTNLCTHYGEVFSIERTPDMSIAEAVRISMSIPLYFAAVRNASKDVYVDGGCLNNYPVKLFDREKYIEPANLPTMGRSDRQYYIDANKEFLEKHPGRSPYIYNKETLGFRLDSKEEIIAFRYNEPRTYEIKKFTDYVKGLIKTVLDSQNNIHLHSDDWHRTIYIDTKGVSTTDFGLSDQKKTELIGSGKQGATDYFKWFDAAAEPIFNRP
jgi:NTE family protein